MWIPHVETTNQCFRFQLHVKVGDIRNRAYNIELRNVSKDVLLFAQLLKAVLVVSVTVTLSAQCVPRAA